MATICHLPIPHLCTTRKQDNHSHTLSSTGTSLWLTLSLPPRLFLTRLSSCQFHLAACSSRRTRYAEPIYPGTELDEKIHPSDLYHYTRVVECVVNHRPILFYELSGMRRGWIHDYDPDQPSVRQIHRVPMNQDSDNTIVFLAAAHGWTEVFQLFAPVDLTRLLYGNDRFLTYSPLLHVAIKSGVRELVHWMLDHRAHIHQLREDNGNTALNVAAYCGHLDIVQHLLTQGAHIHQPKTDSGATPLMLAALRGHHDVVSWLLHARAPIHAADLDGYQALYHAVHKKHVAVAQLLLEHKAHVNHTGVRTYCFPLMLATYQGDYPMIQLLLQHGAQVNQTDTNHTSALHVAADGQYVDIVRLLLTWRANVNQRQLVGGTSLHFAVQQSNGELTRLLLDHQADVHIKGRNGISVLLKAAYVGNLEIIQTLEKNGASVEEALLECITHRLSEPFQRLVVHCGGDWYTGGTKGVLRQAWDIMDGRYLTILLEAGANPAILFSMYRIYLPLYSSLQIAIDVEERVAHLTQLCASGAWEHELFHIRDLMGLILEYCMRSPKSVSPPTRVQHA
jgi:ankyrin repeat protein